MQDEKGFVLVLAIVVMAAMTAIGLAVVTTATTDILIARNEQESKKAFYLAQAGIEEAMGRMGLKETNARFLGETTAQRTNRINGIPPTVLQPNFFTFPGLGLPGSYEVSIRYAYEAPVSPNEPWTDNDGVSSEIILYCGGFGFTSPPAPKCSGNKATPIYEISSRGTVDQTGIDATIVANIAATVFNVVPPAGEVYSNTGTITGGGSSLTAGEVCGNPSPICADHPGGPGVDMTTWLGVNMNDMAGYADAPSPYTQSGAGVVTYNPLGDEWGQICSTLTDTDGDGTGFEATPIVGPYDDVYGPPGGPSHICNNEAKLIFINNAGAGDAKITGGSGRGILVVSGDLDLNGILNWEGMIYVMGKLKGAGTANVFGAMMVNNSITFAGNIEAFGSTDIAMSVADGIGGSKLVRWHRR